MKQERDQAGMRLKASDKTSCLALRCGGASLGGRRGQHPPPVPGAAGKGRAGQGRAGRPRPVSGE